ncbi:MAG: PHP domain-containing protein [Deltaproteobacteria bacterium]|nr:PHP domain-containing protein [Deltaproteobacteria bacterium]
MYIDLHIHTTESDGTLTPSQVVRYAKEKGLKAIAITDHDTIHGNEEAIKEGISEGVEVIPGVEISVDYSPGTMHMLGYFITTEDPILNEKLTLLQDSRADRNPRIIEKLNKLGLSLTYDEVVQVSGGGQVGRPHMAQVLMKKGYTKSIKEAFDKYLGKGAPAYLDKFRLSAVEAITMITDAGGIPVLAHPFTLYCKSSDELDALVEKLVNQGLQGLEVYYSEHDERKTSSYKLLAKRYNLAITGGSDFHGKNMKGIDLGTGRGKLKIPYTALENLKTIWEEKRK